MKGQVWQLADHKLEIGLVGRTLVHLKHYKGLELRPPTQLSSKTSLQEVSVGSKGGPAITRRRR